MEISIQANKLLLSSFFMQAKRLVNPDGEIHVSVKDRMIYRRWELHKLASERSVRLVRIVPFEGDNFPGYDHVATRKGVSKKVDLQEAYTMCWALPGGRKPCARARLYAACVAQKWMLNEFTPAVLQTLGWWGEADFAGFERQYEAKKVHKNLHAAVHEYPAVGRGPGEPSPVDEGPDAEAEAVGDEETVGGLLGGGGFGEEGGVDI